MDALFAVSPRKLGRGTFLTLANLVYTNVHSESVAGAQESLEESTRERKMYAKPAWQQCTLYFAFSSKE